MTVACYSDTAQPVMLWHERGRVEPWRLTSGQWEAIDTLKHAGAKQIMSFLSGEGGVGKSTLEPPPRTPCFLAGPGGVNAATSAERRMVLDRRRAP